MKPQYLIGENAELVIDFLQCELGGRGLEPHRCTLHMYILQAGSSKGAVKATFTELMPCLGL